MTEAIKPYHEAAEFIKERIGAQTPQLGIVLGSGLGALAGKVLRVGVMGEGARPEPIDKLIAAIGACMSK